MDETFRFMACWGNGFQLHLVYTHGTLDEVVICSVDTGCSKIVLADFLIDIGNFIVLNEYYEKMVNNTLTKDDVIRIAKVVMLSWLVKQYMSYYFDKPRQFLDAWEQEKNYIESLIQSSDAKWKVIIEKCD